MKLTNRFEMRCDDAFAAQLNQWRRSQADPPSRSESVRQLVAQGLRYEEAVKALQALLDGSITRDQFQREFPSLFSELQKRR